MTLRILATTLALVLAPTLSLAMCGAEKQAQSCSDGTSYDHATGTCVGPVSG